MHLCFCKKKKRACFCVRVCSSHWLGLGNFKCQVCPALGYCLRVLQFWREQAKGRTILQRALVSCSHFQLRSSLKEAAPCVCPSLLHPWILPARSLCNALCFSAWCDSIEVVPAVQQCTRHFYTSASGHCSWSDLRMKVFRP